MRLTTAQRTRLRALCAEHSAMTMPAITVEALLDALDEHEVAAIEARSELALLRHIARAADKVSDAIAEFGGMSGTAQELAAVIGEHVDAFDGALEPWLKAQELARSPAGEG